MLLSIPDRRPPVFHLDGRGQWDWFIQEGALEVSECCLGPVLGRGGSVFVLIGQLGSHGDGTCEVGGRTMPLLHQLVTSVTVVSLGRKGTGGHSGSSSCCKGRP